MLQKLSNSNNLYRLFMTLNSGIVLYGVKEFILDFSNFNYKEIIKDDSMYPLLQQGDMVIINKQINFSNLLHKVVFLMLIFIFRNPTT